MKIESNDLENVSRPPCFPVSTVTLTAPSLPPERATLSVAVPAVSATVAVPALKFNVPACATRWSLRPLQAESDSVRETRKAAAIALCMEPSSRGGGGVRALIYVRAGASRELCLNEDQGCIE